jgi:hypothetical protein
LCEVFRNALLSAQGQEVTFHIYIQKAVGSNPGRDTEYPDRVLWKQPLSCKCQDGTSNEATNASFHILSHSLLTIALRSDAIWYWQNRYININIFSCFQELL